MHCFSNKIFTHEIEFLENLAALGNSKSIQECLDGTKLFNETITAVKNFFENPLI